MNALEDPGSEKANSQWPWPLDRKRHPPKRKTTQTPKKNEHRTPSRTLAQKRPPPKNLGRWLENATHQNKTQPKPKKKMSAERPRGPWGTKGADSFVGDLPLPMTLAARSKTPPTTTKYRCPRLIPLSSTSSASCLLSPCSSPSPVPSSSLSRLPVLGCFGFWWVAFSLQRRGSLGGGPF